MKFRVFALIVSVALAVVTPVHAAGTHQFGLQGGTSVPSDEEFSDAASAGYNVGGVYQFTIQQYGVGAEFNYHAWNASDDMNAAVPGSEFSFNAWQYGVFGAYNFPTPNATPYVKLGLGAYSPSLKLDGEKIEDAEGFDGAKFGFSVGGGADFNATTSLKLGVSAMYHRLSESRTDFFTVGVRAMWPLKMTGVN